jgi:23S rRNA (adenine2503-C2)-methyltransferase
MPVGRKYTLNFPVTSQTILDAKLFDREKFIVTPIHETASAIENGFQVTGYSDVALNNLY